MSLEKLLLVGRDIRQRSVDPLDAIRRVKELFLHPGLCEQLLAYVQGMEETLRVHFRVCLDADALDETEEAGGAALTIIEAREDLARLLLALKLRPALDDQLMQKLGEIECRIVRTIRWFDREADRVELPVRMPAMLANISKPEDLVLLAWRNPEDWWIGKLIMPPPGAFPRLI